MSKAEKKTGSVLLTGGSGRLGQELIALMPMLIAPLRQDLDLTQPDSISQTLDHHQPSVLIHAAAYTNVSGAEKDQSTCWLVNVIGTRHLVQQALARQLPFIYISTDYVFDGNKGNYAEMDPIGPPRNYYALSKLVAEEIVRILPQHLVIRTSFRPREWPYPVAFTDVYTSQDYVDVIAPDIALAIKHYHRMVVGQPGQPGSFPYSTLHIATERKSVYDLACRRKPDVQAGSKQTANVNLPDDISLNSSRWQALKATLRI